MAVKLGRLIEEAGVSVGQVEGLGVFAPFVQFVDRA